MSDKDSYHIKCTCGTTLKITYDQASKHGRCPECKRTFIIPLPPELTTRRISCRCGVVMEYLLRDAGKISECPKCNTQFRIPGGRTETITNELTKELDMRHEAEMAKVRIVEERPPLSAMVERIDGTSSAVVHVPYIAKEPWAWSTFFLTMLGLLAVLIMGGGLLAYSSNTIFYAKPKSTNQQGKRSNVTIKVQGESVKPPDNKPTDNSITNSEPLIPVEQPNRIRIGVKPSSVNPVYPKNLEIHFTERGLAEVEAKVLTDQIVSAINKNSSAALCDSMDPEVIGNHLFEHTNIPAKPRYLYGSEAIALYRNNPQISTHPVSAQAFAPFEMDGSWVGLMRVSNNTREIHDAISSTEQKANRLPDQLNLSTESKSFVRQFDDWKQNIRNKSNSQSTVPSAAEGRRIAMIQQTPIQALFDHSYIYYVIIGTRSRSGKTVVRDFWSPNYALCLLDATWDTIESERVGNAITSSRPAESQTNLYLEQFKRAKSEKMFQDLMVANIAYTKSGMPGIENTNLKTYALQSEMLPPTAEVQLKALKSLEAVFSNDPFNVMTQALIANYSRVEPEATRLFKRAVELGANQAQFYVELFDRYRYEDNPERAREIYAAFRKNCK